MVAVVDRQLQVYADWDAKQRERIKALITDELIAEHAARPLGQHSDALERVLAYFRRQPQEGKYIIVAVRPWEEYRIGALTGVRGQAARILDDSESYPTEEAAMHGVFLRRVRDLRGLLRCPSCAAPQSTATPTGCRLHPERRIEFKVSCEEPGSYRADVVRLIHGDTNPAGPGLQGGSARDRAQAASTRAASRPPTPAPASSSRTAARSRSAGPFTLHAFVMPTTPGKDGQAIMGRYATASEIGYALTIEGGALTLVLGGGGKTATVSLKEPLLSRLLVLRRGDLQPRIGTRDALLEVGRQLRQQPALADRAGQRRGLPPALGRRRARRFGHGVHARRPRS